jgi:hypothetical protein
VRDIAFFEEVRMLNARFDAEERAARPSRQMSGYT